MFATIVVCFFASLEAPPKIAFIALTLLSIGAAALSYRYVERPFLAGKRGRPWRSVLTVQTATP